MLILLTADQAEKKLCKKFRKIVASDVVSEEQCDGMRHAVLTREFLPDPLLFSNYINGYISKKQYKKAYFKELENDEGKFASLLTIMILYRRGDNVALVCDADEIEFKYLQFLAEYISERYGVKIGTFKELKNKDGKIKNKIGEPKRLEKDIKKHRDILEETIGYNEKKKKKKDKKKSKKKKKDKDRVMTLSCYNSVKERDSFDERFKIVSVKKLFKNK